MKLKKKTFLAMTLVTVTVALDLKIHNTRYFWLTDTSMRSILTISLHKLKSRELAHLKTKKN